MESSKQEMELSVPLPGLWSKYFFYESFTICSKGFTIDFQNRKWNHPNRTWNYFSHFQASDQKTSFTKCFSYDLRGSKLIFKTFFIWSKGFKIDFQNRKWNYPNRKWNYFSHFQASDKKTSFKKCFSFDPSGSTLIFKTGNGIL